MDAQNQIIKPKRLNNNCLIALIAPAGPVSKEQLDKAQKSFSKLGFKTCFSKNILARNGYLAGNDETRIKDLHWAFEDENIDAIVCIRGGYGTLRIVDQINYDLIKQNPKIIVGYSDITVLLNAIFQQTGLITFHGVVGISAFMPYTKLLFNSILTTPKDDFSIFPKDKHTIDFICKGKAAGRLAGGNLSMICSLLGTKYQIDFTNKIAFIEDIGEAPYRIDRLLTQLLLSGSLNKASGIIIGDFKGCDIDNKEITRENSLSLNEIFIDRLVHLNIPILKGFSFGHNENQAIFPIGITASIDSNQSEIQLDERPVI